MKKQLVVVAALAMVSGCASSQDALVKKRDEIRALNAEERNRDTATFSSKEGVRGATWGLTTGQVIAQKGPPAERADNVLMYLDQVDGQQVPTSYVFFEDHLAQVKSRFEPELQTPERLISALKLKWGEPLSDYDKAKAKQEAIDASRRWDFVSLMIGISAAVNTRGRGGLGYYPWAFTTAGSRELIEAQMANEERPMRDVLWATHDTSVHLVALSTGLSEITWASPQLSQRLVRQQMSQAGLEKLAEGL